MGTVPFLFSSQDTDDDGGDGEGLDDVVPTDPRENWFEDLGEASGLDTSPDSDLLSSPGPATESSSFAMVVRRAAEALDFLLSIVEKRKTLLTEVLQPSQMGSEPLLHFNETLTDIFCGT